MDAERDKPSVHAENHSIAIGEINISGTVTGNISIGHTIIQAADAQLRHDLGILLKNVETTWIKGVLERSVHEAALLDLGMEIREEAVDNPWRMVMEAPDQTRETLPRGKKIKDIFYEANGLLLILGEPGSGKTTTLLQLARDLIAEVSESFTHPIPVILNLSTWTNKEQPLYEWLIAELANKYRVSVKDGRRWLEGRRILPLLDGLDEVKAENRAACVEKINQVVKDYGVPAVVCSRIKDYTALNVRLGFYRAIYVQPLTPEQVDEYLKRGDEKLASLRGTLQADEALKSMAQSPLILNIMSLAYQDTSAEALSDPALKTNEARRQHLFNTYIARMFNRKVGKQEYDQEQTKQRLSWLARNMQRHNQEVFLIENLQPSWLPTRGWQWVYVLISRLSSTLILGLFLGLVARLVSLVFGLSEGLLGKELISWLLGGLVLGITIGLPISFSYAVRLEWLGKRVEMRKFPVWQWLNINFVFLSVSLFSSLIFALFFGLLDSLMYGVVCGGITAPIFGLRGSRQSLENDIETVEALHWSWREAFAGGLLSGIGGLILGLILGLGGLLLGGVSFGPLFVLTFGLIGALPGAILIGLRRVIIEAKSSPNQGIHLSLRKAILGGLIIGITFGLMALLMSTLSGDFVGLLDIQIMFWLVLLVAFGLIFGFLAALWYGGLDVIQHYILRLILVIQGYTPPDYARFLNYAVDRIFLQKVGGGYRFIHRLLLEHFVDMSEPLKKA